MTLLSVRYGVPAVLVLLGVLCLFLAPDGTEAEGFALFTGAGVSVLLLNVLHRMGVSGEDDRDREEAARDYFSQHGRWPDEAPAAGRSWRLPQNVATPESEEAARREREGRPPKG
jgi:hypothetical protein